MQLGAKQRFNNASLLRASKKYIAIGFYGEIYAKTEINPVIKYYGITRAVSRLFAIQVSGVTMVGGKSWGLRFKLPTTTISYYY